MSQLKRKRAVTPPYDGQNLWVDSYLQFRVLESHANEPVLREKLDWTSLTHLYTTAVKPATS